MAGSLLLPWDDVQEVKTMTRFTAALLAVVAATSLALAACPGCPCVGGDCPCAPACAPAAAGPVEILRGAVAGIDRSGPGVHLKLETDGETKTVALGPAAYVDAQSVKIEVGDRVEVKAARTAVHGESMLVAHEVRKGDAVLKLRDDTGRPLWAGQGRGPGRGRGPRRGAGS
jgi:hypothetical protein